MVVAGVRRVVGVGSRRVALALRVSRVIGELGLSEGDIGSRGPARELLARQNDGIDASFLWAPWVIGARDRANGQSRCQDEEKPSPPHGVPGGFGARRALPLLVSPRERRARLWSRRRLPAETAVSLLVLPDGAQ